MEYLEGLEDLGSIVGSDEQEENTLALLRRQKTTIQEIREDINSKDSLIITLHSRILELEEYQSKVAILTARIDTLAIVEDQKKALVGDLSRNVELLTASETEKAHLTAQLTSANRRVKDLQALVNTLQQDAESNHAQLQDALHRVGLVETLCERLKAEADKSKAALNAEKAERATIRTRTDEMHLSYEKAIKQQQSQLAELEEKCRSYRSELHDVKRELQSAQDEARRWRVACKEREASHSEWFRKAQEDEQLAKADLTAMRTTCLELSDDYKDVRAVQDEVTAYLQQAFELVQLAQDLRNALIVCASDMHEKQPVASNPSIGGDFSATDTAQKGPDHPLPGYASLTAASATALELAAQERDAVASVKHVIKKWDTTPQHAPSRLPAKKTKGKSTSNEGKLKVNPSGSKRGNGSAMRSALSDVVHEKKRTEKPGTATAPPTRTTDDLRDQEALRASVHSGTEEPQNEHMSSLRADLRACVRSMERSGLLTADDSRVHLCTGGKLPHMVRRTVQRSNTLYVYVFTLPHSSYSNI